MIRKETNEMSTFEEYVERFVEDYTVQIRNREAFMNDAKDAFTSLGDSPTYEGFEQAMLSFHAKSEEN